MYSLWWISCAISVVVELLIQCDWPVICVHVLYDSQKSWLTDYWQTDHCLCVQVTHADNNDTISLHSVLLPRGNDLLCVEWDVKPYTLTHSLYSLFYKHKVDMQHRHTMLLAVSSWSWQIAVFIPEITVMQWTIITLQRTTCNQSNTHT